MTISADDFKAAIQLRDNALRVIHTKIHDTVDDTIERDALMLVVEELIAEGWIVDA